MDAFPMIANSAICQGGAHARDRSEVVADRLTRERVATLRCDDRIVPYRPRAAAGQHDRGELRTSVSDAQGPTPSPDGVAVIDDDLPGPVFILAIALALLLLACGAVRVLTWTMGY